MPLPLGSLRLRMLVLAGWTVVIWGTRIRNIAGDEELTGSAAVRPMTVAVGFTAMAVLLVVGMARRAAWQYAMLSLLLVVTVVYWPIRIVQIALGDHSAGFVAAHVVLASVSVGLSGWCWPRRVSRRVEVRAGR